MKIFENSLEPLIGLWEEWNDTNEDISDDSWRPTMLSLEKNIHETVESILNDFGDDPQFPENLDLDHDEDIQTIIFHIVLSSISGSLFDKNLLHLDYIDNILNDESHHYYEAIGTALIFCDISIQETVVKQMLKSNNEFCIIKAIDVIADSKLIKFRSHCVSMISAIADHGYQEKDQYLLSSLNEAIYSIKAKTCIPALEKLIDDKSLQLEHYKWQRTLFSLVRVNSKIGWDTYKKECLEKTLSPESTESMGFFGNRSITPFMTKQLKENEHTDWKEGYLVALGLLGDPESLDTIIEYIDHEELGIIESSLEAFFTITGARLDEDLDFDALDCLKKDCKLMLTKWLQKNKEYFDSDKRYFSGKPFTFQDRIDNLLDPSFDTRSTAIYELVIYTNEVIHYNANGFVSDMIKSQKAWQAWYIANKTHFPEGYWYIDGKQS